MENYRGSNYFHSTSTLGFDSSSLSNSPSSVNNARSVGKTKGLLSIAFTSDRSSDFSNVTSNVASPRSDEDESRTPALPGGRSMERYASCPQLQLMEPSSPIDIPTKTLVTSFVLDALLPSSLHKLSLLFLHFHNLT